jgi:hypothetical protein
MNYKYSWFDLTLEVLNSLSLAKDAGFIVDQSKVAKILEYLDNYLDSVCGVSCMNDEYAIHTYYILNRSRISFGTEIYPYIFNRVKDIITNEKKLVDNFSNYDLSKLYLSIIESGDSYFDEDKISKLGDLLVARLEIDARGAFLPEGEVNNRHSYYSNEILNTAFLVKAFSLSKNDNALLEKMVMWIISSKDKDGLFGNSLNNVAVIDAFVTYLTFAEDNKSYFNIKFLIDLQEKDSFDFGPKNIFDSNISEYPINSLS